MDLMISLIGIWTLIIDSEELRKKGMRYHLLPMQVYIEKGENKKIFPPLTNYWAFGRFVIGLPSFLFE
jgi:hypothetical protein